MHFFLHFTFIPGTSASDFEEQLGQGLGKDANDALKFMMWLKIVKEEDLKGENKQWSQRWQLPKTLTG